MNAPAEAFLQGFHTLEPRATPRSLSGGRTDDGQSSYQVLASVVQRDLERPTILDLGCGDGHLLAQLAAQFPQATLHGVDLCEADLALARAHPLLGRASLCNERAQSLSAADASLDYVLCHLALMLMSDLDVVAAEIARVLKPAGCFAAILPDENARTPVFDAFTSCFERVARADPGCRAIVLGDPRSFQVEELRSVFAGAAADRTLSVRPCSLRLAGDFEQVWSSLSLTYLLPFLSAAGQGELRQQFEQRARGPADEHGILPFELGLLLIEWRASRR